MLSKIKQPVEYMLYFNCNYLVMLQFMFRFQRKSFIVIYVNNDLQGIKQVTSEP